MPPATSSGTCTIPRHPDFDAEAQRALGGDPIVAVYGALDAAVGELAARADPEATFMLLFSHGMGTPQ